MAPDTLRWSIHHVNWNNLEVGCVPSCFGVWRPSDERAKAWRGDLIPLYRYLEQPYRLPLSHRSPPALRADIPSPECHAYSRWTQCNTWSSRTDPDSTAFHM
ncbi:hypothetical protein RCIA189 [Methanocella arvoryzae MRE50]|uniref:Uncharacterized protein n=1 Tax=Methanocella arvoryzae (strain DSM 22066 / NBRC 105507 / MRE50) TaxID=351160 RepID=Q0W1Z0_METAR|nr:hypothetical protein RCIA189 [Methanocella arvoryzae MRE50]